MYFQINPLTGGDKKISTSNSAHIPGEELRKKKFTKKWAFFNVVPLAPLQYDQTW
jgi:hypothetical protein